MTELIQSDLLRISNIMTLFGGNDKDKENIIDQLNAVFNKPLPSNYEFYISCNSGIYAVEFIKYSWLKRLLFGLPAYKINWRKTSI